MNYDEALEFIHGVSKIGTKLGLENIRRLLASLGNPQKKLKFIHVAGTNGKGTVCSTLSEILMAQGYKVGLYTSPFIYDFCERIRINGNMIERNELACITELVKNKCGEIVKNGFLHPTEFEIVTAIGFYYFAEQNCDFVVLEVGMGGRLDATNAIDAPLVSVISSISFDHTEYLGNTLKEIAYEKCGIIKNGSKTAVYPLQTAEVQSEIEKICKERDVYFDNAEVPQIIKTDLNGCVFSVYGKEYETSLKGKHMIYNIATALCAVRLLRKCDVSISEDAVRCGIENVRWSGRFEVLSRNPLFIIDGAHNVSGIKALKEALNTHLKGRKLIFIMGMLKDKDYQKCLEEIGCITDLFIACTVPSPRTLSAAELGEYAKKYNKNVYISQSVEDALIKALEEADNKTAIIAFGSLYMLGDIRNTLYKLKGV